MRAKVDISAYLVVGPRDTAGRPVGQVVAQAVAAGFTCVQVRGKDSCARELMDCLRQAARAIAQAGASQRVALLVNDRLDVALAARDAGMKVDGVHVGQDDVPADVCRRYLGPDAIVGLTAEKRDMAAFARTADLRDVDYLGAGPLHASRTKLDLATDDAGQLITQSEAALRALAAATPVPVVVGGGVTAADLPLVRRSGLHGFFVVSAVCAAPDPFAAAKSLVDAWNA